ncbi:MAG: mechanosensitive ion channel family protein [Deferrisomatales bacterium]|nr:mechanosensitive ion channel family protein [Deferrisomatales bacterium]
MQDAMQLLKELAAAGHVAALLRSAVLVVVGYWLAKLASRVVERQVARYFNPQRGFILGRIVYYAVVVLTLVSALRQFGFEFTVLLGAAGVLTVAVGFASQTSASNIISGLFLMVEEPFVVGDQIRVGDTIGEVLSIDLLSVKLRTFDNLFVRVPNESMVKSEVTTLTRFPIRRADLKIGVAYKEDIARVREVLMAVADENPLCLMEPKPLFIFLGYGDSSLDIQFSVWAKRENFLDLRNGIYEEIKLAFDAAGIEIPFPHRSLYAGSVTDPFPIRIIDSPAEDA